MKASVHALASSRSPETAARLEVRALAGDVAEIDLFGEIGGFYGISAKMFRDKLNAVTASNIVLRINSPGGDVFDGIAIYNELLTWRGNVVVRVTGLAASAASIVAMAGDTIEIAENAFYMIHNAWTVAVGDRRTMADRATLLEKIDGELAATYARRTGGDKAEIAEQMNAETWLTARDAVDAGFADAILETEKTEASAAFDLSNFKNVPRALKQPRSRKAPDPAPAVTPAADMSPLFAALCGLELVSTV